VNQTIPEALHMVDLAAAHDVQWPPLLQAIAERADP
jgi:hypothetical protein